MFPKHHSTVPWYCVKTQTLFFLSTRLFESTRDEVARGQQRGRGKPLRGCSLGVDSTDTSTARNKSTGITSSQSLQSLAGPTTEPSTHPPGADKTPHIHTTETCSKSPQLLTMITSRLKTHANPSETHHRSTRTDVRRYSAPPTPTSPGRGNLPAYMAPSENGLGGDLIGQRLGNAML